MPATLTSLVNILHDPIWSFLISLVVAIVGIIQVIPFRRIIMTRVLSDTPFLANPQHWSQQFGLILNQQDIPNASIAVAEYRNRGLRAVQAGHYATNIPTQCICHNRKLLSASVLTGEGAIVDPTRLRVTKESGQGSRSRKHIRLTYCSLCRSRSWRITHH
jgi:hypothetical protein